MHYAALFGANICAVTLLQAGANQNATNCDGNTPLALAVLRKHEACTLTLIQAKSDVVKEVSSPFCLNTFRKTPSTFTSEERRRQSIVTRVITLFRPRTRTMMVQAGERSHGQSSAYCSIYHIISLVDSNLGSGWFEVPRSQNNN